MASVSPVLLGVSTLVVSTDRWSKLVCLVASLVHASSLLSGGGESSKLSLLVLTGDDPIDSWVTSNSLVMWVDKDDFVELETGVLTNPVRAEHAEVRALAANTLLGDGLVCSGLFDLAHSTGVSRLSVDTSFLNVSLAASSANADSVDDIALLSLVTELSGLVWARWTLALVDDIKLSVLPGSDSQDKADKVGLLTSPDFFEVLVGSHSII